MQSITDIITAWPSRSELAADLGVTREAVDKWSERGRIPAEYDTGLVASAHARGIGLSYQALAEIRAKRRATTVADTAA